MTFTEGLIEVINLLADKIGVVIDWTNANVVPYLSDLLERFIAYEFTKSLITTIVILLIAIISIIIFFTKLHKIRYKEDSCDDIDGTICFISGIASFVMIMLSFTIVLAEIEDMIELKYLPEKAVIEKLYEIKENIK